MLKDIIQRLLNPRSRLGPAGDMAKAVAASLEEVQAPAYSPQRLKPRHIFKNGPLMIGLIIVLGLFALVLFGPVWAPKNPYIAGQHIVPHFDSELGEFIRPPLEPSAEYPLGTDQWGTDILSMLMHGARNTLVACAFITMVRVLLGVILGAMAGWNEGKNSDRVIMGLVGMLTSLPVLISAMILIYALDIRRGLAVFIVALSVVGWTEIAQYIRSEFLILRKMPFIEGARATGLTNLQIAVRHVLPNVLPQLLVITFLEMGAVLMLLGELGFVGVYIGGGSRIDLSEPMGPTQIFTLADVPEWGAMIADGFRWLRSKPFVVFPPATAFFIAVVGFTSLGEGLRRLLEKQALSTGFLLRKRMLFVVAGLTMATAFVMNNTGAAPWFAKVAQAFNGDGVYDHIAALTEMDGRGVGQPGGEAAAAYIAEQFEIYGLEPGWRRSSYYYYQTMQLVRPLEQPQLSVLDEQGNVLAEYRHQLDFGYLVDDHGGSGSVQAPLTFVGFDRNQTPLDWSDYTELDLRGRIVLLVRGNAPLNFPTEAMIRGAAGVLWITGDGRDDVRSQVQMAGEPDDYLRRPNIPIFRIRPHVAEQLLAGSSQTITGMLADAEAAAERGPGWFTYELPGQAAMSLELGRPQEVEVPSVFAYRPGSDLDVADELVIIFATYDGLGQDPDGTAFPGANHNASGVAMMLELARLWEEQGLDTRRTTMFVAWGGGQLDEPGAADWIDDPFNFRHVRTQSARSNVRPAFLLQLDYVGAGGDELMVISQSSNDFREMVVDTADENDIPLSSISTPSAFETRVVTTRIGTYALFGWEAANVPPDQDILATIDQTKLQQFGKMFALLLTRLVRETSF